MAWVLFVSSNYAMHVVNNNSFICQWCIKSIFQSFILIIFISWTNIYLLNFSGLNINEGKSW